MHIRSILIMTFLTASMVPSAIFGWMSFTQGLNREFAEVEDRHLLLAQNVGAALERYHTDLVGTFEPTAYGFKSRDYWPGKGLTPRDFDLK